LNEFEWRHGFFGGTYGMKGTFTSLCAMMGLQSSSTNTSRMGLVATIVFVGIDLANNLFALHGEVEASKPRPRSADPLRAPIRLPHHSSHPTNTNDHRIPVSARFQTPRAMPSP
jgi:hypothetical protein